MKLQGRVVWITGAASGITVTMLVLGGIRTNISVNALHGDGTPHGSMDSIQSSGIDADVCAERIIKAVEKGKREITIGLIPKTRLALFLSRWAPSILSRLMRKAKVT